MPGRLLVRSCLMLALLHVSMNSRTSVADPLPPPAIEPQAKDYLDAGLRLFDEGKFVEAIAQLRLALSIQRHPDVLYALGQAERKRGDCDKALVHFRAAAQFALSNVAREALQIQIERCQQQQLQTTTSEPPPQAEPRSPSRSSPNWLGHALTASGVIAIASGTILYVQARSTIADAGIDYEHHGAALDARTRGHIGAVVAGTGVALVVAGVLRYVTRRESASVKVSFDASFDASASGAVVVGGTF